MRRSALPLLIVAVCLTVTAGCFLLDERQATPVPATAATPVQTTGSALSTLDPADMALQLRDLPAGYIIRERADIAYSDISPLARDQGWKRGYLVSFYQMNAEKYDITAISQRISIYQIDNVHLLDRTMGTVFDAAEAELRATANASITVTELPFPRTGDRTAAFRIIDANDQYGVTRYVVLITRKNVMESVEMRGTTTDYEMLKTLVRKADEKIR